MAERRPIATTIYGLPLSPTRRWHPKVGGLTGRGSLSIGTVTSGFVVNCVPLPAKGPHHIILEEHSGRGTDCAVDEMIGLLLEASARVAKGTGGGILTVGNLSRRGGGDLPWSISHNSGRDADVGFYLVDDSGQQVIPRSLVPLDRHLRGQVSDRQVHLDLDRTWAFVKAVLTSRRAEVQWIFVARWIKRALLKHAKRKHEPGWLVAKADEAMLHPPNALPHDDHMHVRIYCPRDDLLEGCRDIGTVQPWHAPAHELVQRRLTELRRLLKSHDLRTRAGAIVVLGRMDHKEDATRLARHLRSAHPLIRRRASRAIAQLGVHRVWGPVRQAIARSDDPSVVSELLQGILHIRWRPTRLRLLSDLLRVNRALSIDMGPFALRLQVNRWSLWQIVRVGGPRAVEVLARALGTGTGLDHEIISALEDLTDHRPPREMVGQGERALRGYWVKVANKSTKVPRIRWIGEILGLKDMTWKGKCLPATLLAKLWLWSGPAGHLDGKQRYLLELLSVRARCFEPGYIGPMGRALTRCLFAYLADCIVHGG